jgi:hypothetical protein
MSSQSILIEEEFACEPHCKWCEMVGPCPKVRVKSASGRNAQEKAVSNGTDVRIRGGWFPNREKDTPLKCGCAIPWPIVQAFGQEIHGQVWCSEHGWQPKLTKAAIEKAKKIKGRKLTAKLPDVPPF